MAVGRRLSMVVVGVFVFAAYAAAAAVVFGALVTVLRADVSLTSTVFAVVAVTLVFGYASYRFGTQQALSQLDARPLTPDTSPEVYRRLNSLADDMDAGRPTVYVARMPMPNAISLGGRGGAVVFDRSLFRLLNADEFEGVLAHELAHLESHDSLVQTLAYSVARTVVGLLAVLLLPFTLLVAGVRRFSAWARGRPLERKRERRLGSLVAVVLVALTLVVRAHSRSREFAADERAVEITHRPLVLASALRKIERASQPAGGILSPFYVHTDEDAERWFSTHPSMDERIDKLREMGTGIDVE